MELESFFHKLGLHIEEDQWERGDKLVESLKHGLELLGAAEALKGLKEMVNHTVEAAVGAKRLGQEIGFSTQSIQELGYAASVSGSSAEAMAGAMGHLSRGMQEAKSKGSGPLIEGLQAMHLSFDAIRNKTPEQTFSILVDRLSKMPDGFKKTAAAADLFGREAGPQLIPFINKGIAGIGELRDEAEDLGVVLGDDGVEQAEKFEEGQKRLGGTLTGIKNQIVSGLLPVLTEVFGSLQKWIVANKEVIKADIQAVVRGMISVIKELAKIVGEVADFVEDNWDTIEAALIVLGTVIATFAAEAAIAWALAFWPLVLVGAVISGVILAVKKLWSYLSGDSSWKGFFQEIAREFGMIKDFFVHLPDKIKAAADRAWEAIKDGFSAAFDFIRNMPVVKQILDAIEWARSGAKGIAARAATSRELSSVDNLNAGDEIARANDIDAAYARGLKNIHTNVIANATPVAAQHVSVNSAPTIVVQGSGLPAEQIATMVDAKIKKSSVDANRQAIDAVKSGARK